LLLRGETAGGGKKRQKMLTREKEKREDKQTIGLYSWKNIALKTKRKKIGDANANLISFPEKEGGDRRWRNAKSVK